MGLRCGLEIHQQLDGKKLFCNCPVRINDGEPDASIKRRLRAVVGETGEMDEAALHEQERKKVFEYNFYDDCCCLVELDDEPPHKMNSEAIITSLIVSNFLNAKIVDEGQVMRKTVVDGSNTTGFQRTTLIAMDGILEGKDDQTRIETICLEEDSAKIVERGEECDVYNLSRLGIPLIEIATAPDIKTPEDVKVIAEKIGDILRSTGKCKRGLGTIRQDVNVSIKNGNRVEIKGAQDLKMLPLIVEQEINRQISLLEIRDMLNDDIKGEIVDLSDIFLKTDAKVISKALKKGGVVFGMKLEGFAGVIGKEVQVDRRLGSEFSDYAKVKAGVGGIFHSDELPHYGIRQEDVDLIRKSLKLGANDAFVLVADLTEKAENALKAVAARAGMARKGVPKEVRKTNLNGSTSYLRPMPGGARMYPETDVMPVEMNFDFELPELIEDKARRYQKEMGLSFDLAKSISKSDFNDLFERLCNEKGLLKPSYVAEILVSFPIEISRDYEGAEPALVKEKDLEKIFDEVSKGNISKASVMDLIVDVSMSRGLNIEKYKNVSDDELEKGIKRIINENRKAPLGAIIGMVMKEFNADGKKVKEIVKKHKGEE